MAPILKIATVTYDLQKKWREFREQLQRKRSDVDELLAFSDWTDDSLAAARQTAEQMRKLRDEMFR